MQVQVKTKVQIGLEAELKAKAYLQKAGYCIIEQRFRYKGGEIDLIAKEESLLCFIEVRKRSRSDFGGAAASVNLKKQKRIIKCAQVYLSRCPKPWPRCRFDVLTIDGDSENIQLIKNAFRVEG